MRGFLLRHKRLWKLVIAALVFVPFFAPFTPYIPDFLRLDLASGSIQVALVLLAFGLVLNSWTTYRYLKRPLSVVKSEIDMEFLDPGGRRVKTDRRLLIRAEHPGITAKYRSITETQGGRVLKDSVEETLVPNNPNDKLLMLGTDKSLLLVNRFENALPYSWVTQLLIPDWICRQFVRLDRAPSKWFRTFLVVEHSTMTEIGEYELQEAEFRITANRYSSSDVRIKLTFHSENPPRSITGLYLKSLTVEDAEIEKTVESNGALSYCITFHKLRNEIARVGWVLSNDPNQMKLTK